VTAAGRLGLTPGDRPATTGSAPDGAPVIVEGRGDRLQVRTSSPRAALALWRSRRRLRPVGRALAFAGLGVTVRLGPLPAIPLRLG